MISRGDPWTGTAGLHTLRASTTTPRAITTTSTLTESTMTTMRTTLSMILMEARTVATNHSFHQK